MSVQKVWFMHQARKAQGKEAQQHVQEQWTSPAATTAPGHTTEQSRDAVCMIPSRNELLHKVELSTGVKPCSPVLLLSSQLSQPSVQPWPQPDR